nr:SWI/SNF2 family helicase [Cedratvirus borely]
MDLADLVYTYPEVGEPGFQSKITAKYEFASLATSPVEAVPRRGTPFKHQAICLRYMLQYDRLFLIHEPGTGKTCTSVFSAESNLRRDLAVSVSDYILDYIQPKKSTINRIYVLTRGPTLRDEFLFQIICRCTTRYDTEALNNISSEAMRERRIHGEVSKYYSILTYGGLVREVEAKKLSDEQIASEYANSFFIIDEPQYLADPELGEDKNSYSGLLKILRLARNSKIMATTATPMINDVNEIANMLNLVLPEEKALSNEVDYNNVTLEDMAPILSGYVSYIRAFDTGLEVDYVGDPIGTDEGETEIKVYGSEMGELQNQVYEEQSSFTQGGTAATSFYNRDRQIANFVFPNQSFGREGFIEHIDTSGPDIFTAKREFAAFARSRKNLQSMSGKADAILTLLEQIPGNHFIYSNSKLGSGAALLAAILKLHGYTQYLENTSAFADKEKESGYCLNAPANKAPRRIRIPPAKRFAIITPETPSTRRRSLLELYNSHENMHGDYIQVMIAPPVAKAGINLSNVVAVHLFDPDWNEAGNYQAISRAIRATSHVALLQEERERAVQQNRDPKLARVLVRVYRHVAIPLNEDLISIDTALYLRAETKDREIRRMLRILKQLAIDCHLNKGTNVRPTDVDGSQACDYTTCDYPCLDPAPTEIDYTSFNVLYSRPYVDEIAQRVTAVFLERLTISIEEIFTAFTEYEPRYILMAISKLVENKIPFSNKYGKISYLRESDGYLYLENELPVRPGSFPLSFYSENLIAVQTVPLETLTTRNKSEETEINVSRLLQIPVNSREWEDIFSTLSTEGLVLLLETIISYGRGLITLPYTISEDTQDRIEKEFFGLWYSLHEPKRQLDSYKSQIERARGPGRPLKKGNLPKLTGIDFGSSHMQRDTEIVYIHTVYDINRGATSAHGTGKRGKKVKGRIRILKPSEGEWRDTTDIENKIYTELFNRYVGELHSPYEVNKIYGILQRINNKFRIRDRTTENTRLSKSDLRYIKDGRTCTSWNKPMLVGVMWQLEIPPPPKLRITISFDEIMTALQKRNVFNVTNPQRDFDEEKAIYFYKWIYLADKTIEDMCQLIYKVLEESDRLLVI